MNIFGKIQNEYEHLWKQIIRPNRSHYSQESLGPSKFNLENVDVLRQDFQLTSMRNLQFQGSIWLPEGQKSYDCVVYLHSSQGNRIQCMEYLGNFLKQNIAVCGFDFCGCGNAEGQFITMGYYEQQDVKQVMDHLAESFKIRSLAIWGRSMGAVAALQYLGKTIDVKAVVLDSPYKHLKNYIEQALKKSSSIPSLMVGGAVKVITKTIEEKAGFDPSNVNPLKYNVPGLHLPVLFVAPAEDEQALDSCKKLFEAYAGEDKQILPVKQKQNDSRSEQCIDHCVNFIRDHFGTSQAPKKQSKKQFDFFDDNPREQKKQKEVKVPKPQVIEEFEEPKMMMKEEERQQKSSSSKKDFSLMGLLSIFSKKEQAKEERTVEPNDEYSDLRRVLKQTRNQTQLQKGKQSEEIERKMGEEIKKQGTNSQNQDLRKWVYCRV